MAQDRHGAGALPVLRESAVQRLGSDDPLAGLRMPGYPGQCQGSDTRRSS